MAGQTIGKVVAGGKTHTVTSTFYGTCATAAATAAKEVIINEVNTTEALSFINGMTLAVKFTNANGVANPTLTLYNNSGTAAAPTKGSTTLLAAKPIYRYGTTRPSTSAASSWIANSVVVFVYDGAGWQEVHSYDNNDNTVPAIYCSTAAGTAEKIGTLTNGALVKGYYTINVTTANTSATALKLNVNNKGAKPIYINGTASSTSNHTLPAGFYIVYYDGSNFHFRTDGKIPCLITSDSLTTTSITPVTSKQVGVSVTNTAISTSQVSNGVLDLTGVLKNVVLNLGASVTTESAINVVTGAVT